MTELLTAGIEAHIDTWTRAAVDEIYRDPFWQDRFGDRGRRFSEEDGRHHLSYLVQALTAGDPEVLAGYARWLQAVLTTRGMCTLHLDDNFARLQRIIAADLADAGEAVAYLGAAREALRYPGGRGRQLQDRAAHLAQAVAAETDAAAGGALTLLLSYLGDALALSRPAIFEDHVAWRAGFLQRQGLAEGALIKLLDALIAAVLADTQLAEPAHGDALAILTSARRRITDTGAADGAR